MSDPVSGKTGGLLRGDASDPLVIETNTSTEYWQKGASLIHTDPAGVRDAQVSANVRVYLVAGTQHGGRAGLTTSAGPCVNSRNPHSAGPALRALLAALDEWVAKGTPAPANRVPSILAGTAVLSEAVKMPAVKGFVVPKEAHSIGLPVDWINPPGSEPAFAVASAAKTYGVRVPAVDVDGNETAGIRSPDIAVPLATYTGWNLYKAEPSELCDRDGSYLPFAKTKAEREASGDPRPSIEERYGSRDAYVAKVKAAADALVADRLLLRADADAYVRAAQASDRF